MKATEYRRATDLAVRLAGASKQPEHETARIAASLLTIADRLHRYYETACNYELTPRQEARIARLEATARAEVNHLEGVGIKFNADPRGYAVKLLLPDGSYNTWGGTEEGWGI